MERASVFSAACCVLIQSISAGFHSFANFSMGLLRSLAHRCPLAACTHILSAAELSEPIERQFCLRRCATVQGPFSIGFHYHASMHTARPAANTHMHDQTHTLQHNILR